MPRKLKVYQTSLGFFDLAIAAPSMKAALEAWGAGSNLFHQGVAKESDDRKVIDAAMEKPGTILQRPVGTDGPFREHADLPTAASLDVPARESKSPRKQPKAAKARKIDEKAERRAAAAFEKEQKRRGKIAKPWTAERPRKKSDGKRQRIGWKGCCVTQADRPHSESAVCVTINAFSMRGDRNASGRALGRTANRAASLSKITEQLRESHGVEYAVRRHAAFTCHLNTPMHMVELADRVGIRINAEDAAVIECLFVPAPVEIEPPWMSVYLDRNAVFGARF
jgi:colicin import membrane protein